MRNIKIVNSRQKDGSVLPTSSLESAIYCLGEHGTLYICSDGSLLKYSLEGNEPEAKVICEARDFLQDAVLIQYVVTTGIIYVVNRRGSFLQFMIHGHEVEELFQSEQGIAYFSVSPDSRYTAIVTKEGTLLLLTLPDLETLAQVELFEGESTNVTNLSEVTVKIVWREDSQYFAVNYCQNQKYQIKLFDEAGALHSKTEEEIQLLDSILEWQPSGGLLAAVGQTPHGTVVSVFERNGLKRADFYPYEGTNQKYEDDKIKGINWNTSSDVLAITHDDKVELWCRNNYVWMRKIIIDVATSSQQGAKLVYTHWDREHNYRLHIIDSTGKYTTHDIAFTYSTGFAAGSALVASWNGNSIYSTPFRNSCCPPPQCLYQSTCEAEIKSVIVPEFWSGFLVVTCKGDLVFWRYDKEDGLREIRTIPVVDFNLQRLQSSYDWLWPNRNTICCVSNNTLIVLSMCQGDFEEPKSEVIIGIKKVVIKEKVVSASLSSRNQEDSTILLQTVDGLVLKMDLSSENCTNLCKLPQIFTSIQQLDDSVVVAHDPLTRKLMLGWTKYPESDPVTLSTDCTSFAIFQTSIIYVTIQGYLEIRNADYVMKLLGKHVYGNPFSNEEDTRLRYTRKCEKGSQIVTCCLNQMLEPALILQIIPRGNLEIIYPRPLVIDTIKMLMREKENDSRYEKIMGALRRHRIDYRILIDEMRILIEEDPDYQFRDLLKTMVAQVKNSHSLVLLVTDLNHEYSDCIFILKNILEKVIKDSPNKRLLHVEESYLAAMAKLGLLEEALKSSLILGEDEENRELVQHRVKFLSFYCENPDILFDTALGTYDLSLASLVADCLGKDPKEYLPILEGFQSMLELKRRFKIDDKLRRFNKAVIHLIKDGRIQHEEIVKYMERHRLFTDVITFLKNKLRCDEGGVVERSGEDTALLLREAQSSYGIYLEERAKFLEASILFRESGNVDKAINCGTKAGQWEFALEIAYGAGKSDDEMKNICKSVLTQLEDKKMFGDAARLCETYLNDVQQTVYFLIKDKKWQHASTLALRSPSLGQAYRDGEIKSRLLDTCAEQKELILQTTDDIENKLQRFRRVKDIKAEKLAENGGNPDNFSDTESFISGSSVSGSISSSNMSGKSYRSGKNKRKLERKVYSLKEGSKYEDLAIIAHLWNIMEKIQNEMKPDIVYTVESLWKFDECESATSTCIMLENLLNTADRCIQEVWNAPITDEILELKYRFPLVSWTPVLTKLSLHESSSKAWIRYPGQVS